MSLSGTGRILHFRVHIKPPAAVLGVLSVRDKVAPNPNSCRCCRDAGFHGLAIPETLALATPSQAGVPKRARWCTNPPRRRETTPPRATAWTLTPFPDRQAAIDNDRRRLALAPRDPAQF